MESVVVRTIGSRTAKVALLLETFSFVSFFDVYQRKSPALQRGIKNLKPSGKSYAARRLKYLPARAVLSD
jgi:hypothetical protein